MKKKLKISESVMLKLEELKNILGGMETFGKQNPEINALDGCGGHCHITCSWYCMPECVATCQNAQCQGTCQGPNEAIWV